MNRIYIFIGIVLLFSMVLAIYTFKRQDGIRAKDATPEKYERKIKTVTYWETAFEDTTTLSRLFGSKIIKANKGHFYIGSLSDKKMYRFDLSGKLIHTIGEGEGRGPGEMLFPVDFSVDRDYVWVVDSRLLSIHKFTKEGQYLQSRTIKGHPLRIIAQENKLVLFVIGRGNGIFVSIPKNLESEEITEFGVLIEDQMQNIMSMNGELVVRENQGFMYIPSYASLIYYYDKDDSLDFVTKAPDGQPFIPTIDRSTSERMMVMAPDPDIQTKGFAVAENRLYTLVNHRAGKKENPPAKPLKIKQFIDVYALKNGAYQYSFSPPEGISDFEIIGNFMIVITNSDEIKKYAFSQD